jgi:hypothetical protein
MVYVNGIRFHGSYMTALRWAARRGLRESVTVAL